jgi:GNAT superfamily N-acetyltransferase
MEKPSIRVATVDDAATILRFITDLAIYEKAEHEVKASEADIRRTLFAADSSAYGLICLLGDKPIGFAVYFFNYSTWLGKRGLFLEDLYIVPDQRGVGAGKAMFKHLAQLAVRHDCGRFEWNVLKWNQPAIDFYKSTGAKPQSEWVGYRLTGAALAAFAEADA